MNLELVDIRKSFEGVDVLRGISFGIDPGEVIVLLGPSGCGKTTLLRIIAGLEKQYQGEIFWYGREIRDLPVHRRGFGMVFQDFALFPHKSVSENIEFGLKMQSWPANQRDERVAQMLLLVGLDGYDDRSVYDLSGGEKQRVALARSLAPSPQLLLLDEPLSSLDRALRERLMIELRQILKRAGQATGNSEGIASIYVTHDQEEAFSLADRVIVIGDGQVEQIGTPTELYSRPKNSYVARFLGMKNHLDAELVSSNPTMARTDIGDLKMADPPTDISSPFTLLIRPEAGRWSSPDQVGEQNVIEAIIKDVSFRGRHRLVNLQLKGDKEVIEMSLEFPSSVPMLTDDNVVWIYLLPDKLMALE